MIGIGQFSKVCLVTVKTLHHYDKIGLIHPYSVDPDSGYRYYDESQIPAMLLICRLKRYGFALSEIKEMLTPESENELISKLKEQERILQERIEETSLVLGELSGHLRNIERTGDIMGYQKQYTMELEETKDRMVMSSRQMMGVEDYGKYYGRLYERAARDKLDLDGTILAIYHDEAFSHDCNDTELALGVALPGQADRILRGGLCAVTTHLGGYSGLSDAYGALTRWIEENGLEIQDSPYEVYVRNRFDRIPPEEWETRIYFPVKKK